MSDLDLRLGLIRGHYAWKSVSTVQAADVKEAYAEFDSILREVRHEAAEQALRQAAHDSVAFGIPGLSTASSPEDREAIVRGWLADRADNE